MSDDLAAGGAGDAPSAAAQAVRTDPARWHMLLIFCTLTFTNAFLWIAFSPVAALTQSYYGVSLTLVNLLSVIFMLMYLPGSMAAMYTVTKFGLRSGVSIGALLNAGGGWVRYASVFVPARMGGWPASYAVLFLGQTLAALGQPMLTNIPPRLASEWFPESQRDVATVIASLFNPLGNAAGQLVPAALVSCVLAGGVQAAAQSGNACPTRRDVHGMESLLLSQAILASVSSAWALCLFRGQPAAPPSQSAALRRTGQQSLSAAAPAASPVAEIMGHTATMLRDAEFCKLMIGFGLGLAVFNALLTVLLQLILPLYDHAPAGG